VIRVYDADHNLIEGNQNAQRAHCAHAITGWEANFIENHTPAPNVCALLAISPR
jgi:hypothetical protein